VGQALNGVKVSGGIVVAGTCSTNAADIAEYYGSNGTLTNGQVVIATGDATSFLDSSGHHQSKAYVDITTGPTTTPIIGVISTNPNIPVLGDGIFTPEENPVPVALAGRVPVLVTNENGPIHVGDRLTISNTIPGYAAKATTSGWTIGTALQSSLSDTAERHGWVGPYNHSCRTQEKFYAFAVEKKEDGYYANKFGSSTKLPKECEERLVWEPPKEVVERLTQAWNLPGRIELDHMGTLHMPD
jgi:hypothetical protein